MRLQIWIIAVAVMLSLVYIIDVNVIHTNHKEHGIQKYILDTLYPGCTWPPDGLRGRHNISRECPSHSDLINRLQFMRDGHYKPTMCKQDERIAIIIPYRDRELQLRGFMDNVIPMLKRQQRDFTIYIAEQAPGSRFNRGMMRNVGFVEAEKDGKYDCYVFHDVDVIPEDDRNVYACGNNPRHIAGLMDRHQYRLKYESLFGGIVAFRPAHFQLVNGYSNQYFVWGSEDDDLYRRLRLCKLKVARPFLNVSHCSGISHTNGKRTQERLDLYDTIAAMRKEDGLRDLTYNLVRKEYTTFYRRIYVTVNETAIVKGFLPTRLQSTPRKVYGRYPDLFPNMAYLIWLKTCGTGDAHSSGTPDLTFGFCEEKTRKCTSAKYGENTEGKTVKTGEKNF